MNATIEILLLISIGFAGGIAVGSGFVAFLTVLGIIPRLMQLTKTMKYIRSYEWSVVLGATIFSLLSLNPTTFGLPPWLVIPIGLADGIFVGMLAAAITEVINVFPILAKRIGVQEKLVILIMAIVLGKVLGSMFHWVYFVDFLN